MTKSEWLACREPKRLIAVTRDRVSDRKLRLAGAAAFRRRFKAGACLDLLDTVEQFCDTLPTPAELEAAQASLHPGHCLTLLPSPIAFVEYCVSYGPGSPADSGSVLAGAVREVIRYPFHPIVFSPEWRTDTAVALAAQMYDSRDFSLMPILADALQDARCDSDDILDHCRGPGPHVRGCWVVDLVLGKE
jgi:hypothetical protein